MMSQYDELYVPLVIVHGSADRNVPVEHAARLNRDAPNAELVVVPGASHELMFTHPQAVMDAIAAVEAVSSRASY
ncbi:MAG: prolyl oligopeptidase family serine peptidase [Anaerolineae bacterium]|jgi:pimeloyl-ACP methyl ester carboxylesterase